MDRRMVRLDGLTPEEILALPDGEIDALVLCGEAVVFRAGSAEILGRFWIEGDALALELAQIEGGGEGVLPTIASVAQRYARRRGLAAIDWRVHAIDCAKPNLKLRALLERRGFSIEDVAGSGRCFHRVQPVE